MCEGQIASIMHLKHVPAKTTVQTVWIPASRHSKKGGQENLKWKLVGGSLTGLLQFNRAYISI